MQIIVFVSFRPTRDRIKEGYGHVCTALKWLWFGKTSFEILVARRRTGKPELVYGYFFGRT